jgi:hypothetical protein
MDFFAKTFAQLAELFRSMTPAARITTGLLLAAVVISLHISCAIRRRDRTIR